MPLILYACVEPDCFTLYFKSSDGLCPSCFSVGHRVSWALKPSRGPDVED